jgi:serine/threonine protein kinase
MPYSGNPWFPPGAVLFSQGKATYEMLEDLGPGHHGERVLVALRRFKGKAGGRVILKALPLPDVTSTLKVARKRLEEEVQLATYLHHPNIAHVYGMHINRGALYVIMEYVAGRSLHSLVDVSLTYGRYFPESFMLYVGAQVAGALVHAHSVDGSRDPLKFDGRVEKPAP